MLITPEIAAGLLLLPLAVCLLGLYVFSAIGAFIEALWDRD